MLPLGLAANILGDLLLAALGVGVLLLAPRRGPTLALSAFAILFALSQLAARADEVWPAAPDGLDVASVLLRAPIVGALVAVALLFPTPLRAEERRLLVLPCVASALHLASTLGGYIATFGAADRLEVFRLAFSANGPMLGVALLIVLRADASADAVAQRQLALSSSALVIVPAVLGSPVSSAPYEVYGDWTAFALLLLLAALWLRAGTRRVEARVARNAALWTAGMVLVGALIGSPSIRGYGIFGLLMLATVAPLAYAILRYQLLGIDVKLRWTLSRSTVAAVFVAVFFLASEGAQILFGRDNQLVGLVAAGGLVFALAPLQRAADRLAERAVPVAAAPAPGAELGRREGTYRDTARYLLRAERFSHEEELHLARLATDLGLTPERATQLRHQVEREAAAAPG